jgi:transcriptional regulator with XRE-family HTH domain
MTSKKEPDAVDAHVAQRIKFRRIMLGHSQEDLGRVLGLSFQQIQKYENGSNRISAGRLFTIANFLHVPVTFFFEEMHDDEEQLVSVNDEPVNTDFMTNKEAVKLCQAFSRIQNQNVRTNLIQMTSAIAGEADWESASAVS